MSTGSPYWRDAPPRGRVHGGRKLCESGSISSISGRARARSRWRATAELGEALGYHLLMISDHVAITPDVAGALSRAALRARSRRSAGSPGSRRRVELGTTVIILPYRHPARDRAHGRQCRPAERGPLHPRASAWAGPARSSTRSACRSTSAGAMTDDYLAAIKTVWAARGRLLRRAASCRFRDVAHGSAPAAAPASADLGRRRQRRRAAPRRRARRRLASDPDPRRLAARRRPAAAPRDRRRRRGSRCPPLCPRIRLRLTDDGAARRRARGRRGHASTRCAPTSRRFRRSAPATCCSTPMPTTRRPRAIPRSAWRDAARPLAERVARPAARGAALS